MDPTLGFLSGIAGAVIPGIGAQASAQMQRRWALDDLERQNEYNSPAAQLQRLKAAGLPAASFFSGGVSSQSDMPRSSNVDPTLGYAEGVQNFMQNRMQQAQIRAIEANARGAEADANIKEIDANYAKQQHPMQTDHKGNPITFGAFRNRQRDEIQAAELEYKHQTAAIQARIRSWQDRYGDQLQDEELRHLGMQIARGELQIENERAARQFTNDFIEAYQNGNIGKAIGALIGQYMQSAANRPISNN